MEWVHTLGQSSDGKFLYAVDNTRTFFKWDTKTWNQSSSKISFVPTQITSHPTKYQVVIDDGFCDKNCKTTVLNTENFKTIRSWESNYKDSYAFNPDGTRLYGETNNNQVRIYSEMNWGPLNIWE